MTAKPRPPVLLLVDDDELNRDMLSRRLERHDFEIVMAASGPEALSALSQHSVDLVLLDIQMPGMSGIDVLQEVRRTRSSGALPIIMVTAKDRSEDIVEALSLGANDFVSKPVDLPVVLARIQNQLARRQVEADLRESEERYAVAVAGANDGLWDWKLDTNDVYYSPRWAAALGYEHTDITPTLEAWFDRMHPDDMPHLHTSIKQHIDGESAHLEVECRMRHSSGTYRWILIRGLAVRGPNGAAVRMAGSLTDITKGKVADVLTSLPNRVLFMDRLSRCIEQARRRPQFNYGLLFIDLDRFKVVNDSLGHAAGDELLVETARRLERAVRSGDTVGRMADLQTVARLGGDEFTVLLPDLSNPADSTRVAARILEALERPFHVNGHELYVSASIGIVVGDHKRTSGEDAMRDADTALYRAKALGRGRFELFDATLREQALERLRVEASLRKAIERNELRLHYQPLIDLTDGQTIGFEALIRWQHSDGTLVMPDQFVPLAEETGLIVPIGRWAIAEACRQVATWRRADALPPGFRVSVNLSSREFQQADLVDFVKETLATNGLRGNELELEITESTAMEHADIVVERLLLLKAAGVSLSMDDFGSGYSSLRYLHRFPIDRLKIDRSFVSRLETPGSDDGAPIVRAILALASHIGIDVVAEGIERSSQRDLLRDLNCQFGQGYLFSRPTEPGTAIEAMQAESCATAVGAV